MTGCQAMAIFAAALVVGAAVSYSDLKTMTIPNWMSVGSLVLFAGMVLLFMGVDALMYRAIGALVVFVVCFLLFWAGQLGGGDAKIAPAFALLIAPVDASFTLLMLAVLGVLGLAVLTLLRRTRMAQGDWKIWSETRSFPYGVTLSMTLVLYTGLIAFAQH